MTAFSGQVVGRAMQWLGLLISIAFLSVVVVCIKRLYFHPLAKIPGPFLGRITNLYGAYHAWKGDYHEDILRCHLKYGDHVRYSPNRILFNTAAGFRDIYSHQSNVIKSEAYNQMVHHAANILTLRDKTQHGVRRRILSQGFSESALRGFEPAILAQIEKFVNKISPWEKETDDKWSRAWNMSREFDYLAFDMMADIVFSGSYNAIEKPDYRHIISSIEASNVRISVLIQEAKLRFGRLDKKLFPGAIAARNTFVAFVSKMLSGRLSSQKSDYKDILSLVQKAHDPETGKKFGPKELAAESATLIVAGSDTTSTTMAALFFYLSRYPATYRLATQEIRSTFTSLSDIRAGPKLNSCVYLRACIDETMRITPPVGSSLWREVDTGGAVIDGVALPAGVDVGTGIYALHHNSALYPDPEVYKPERWLRTKNGANSGAVRVDSGLVPYSPFSVGPRSCVGKPLALMELMLTTATLLWKFDFKDEDEKWDFASVGDEKLAEPGMFKVRDHITSAKDGPMLRFALRADI